MNINELAALLNGREYGDEITKEEESIARENGLVVMFGYSDDNTELRGAIYDEVGGFGTHKIRFDEDGILTVCECECIHFQNKFDKAKVVTAIHDESGYTWYYTAEIPHAKFDILEEGEKYCSGIVFDINSLK